MPSPAVIEEILADPAFHANLHARAAALKEGTHPEDLQQNTDAAAIITQAEAIEEATDESVAMAVNLMLGALLVSYIETYFPNL